MKLRLPKVDAGRKRTLSEGIKHKHDSFYGKIQPSPVKPYIALTTICFQVLMPFLSEKRISV
jgi:hypothetical protein